MDRPTSKAALLAEARQERIALADLLSAVTTAQLDETGWAA